MTQLARWQTMYGKARRSSARYVSTLGTAHPAGIAGDWTFRVSTTTSVRRGPSTKERTIATFIRGKEVHTRWITERGEPVDGHPAWVCVETSTGQRGWIPITHLSIVDRPDPWDRATATPAG